VRVVPVEFRADRDGSCCFDFNAHDGTTFEHDVTREQGLPDASFTGDRVRTWSVCLLGRG
jgi:hypothetical protein